MKRVVITGMGVISPLGNSVAEVYKNAYFGHSGINRFDASFAGRLTAPVAGTVVFDGADYFAAPKLRMLDRTSQLALVATHQALAHAGALGQVNSDRVGVFLGTAMGGSHSTDDAYQTLYETGSDRIKPYTLLMGMHNAPAAWIGIEHDVRGPNLTFSTACSSSAIAIGEAWLRIANGTLDMALAGGAEAPLSFGSFKAWEALNTLAAMDASNPPASCKPFSKNRSGMVLSEGAAMIVLESRDSAIARGAPIHGELLGYGVTTDTGHITRPSVVGQSAAIHAALRSARIDTFSIDAINAHGTGTLANDTIETEAIKEVFGKRAYSIPISATKAIHGHLLGAAGALECLLSLLALQHSVILPSMHLDVPDPVCDLDYASKAARDDAAVHTMLSNSFAFGGTNAALVLRAAS